MSEYGANLQSNVMELVKCKSVDSWIFYCNSPWVLSKTEISIHIVFLFTCRRWKVQNSSIPIERVNRKGRNRTEQGRVGWIKLSTVCFCEHICVCSIASSMSFIWQIIEEIDVMQQKLNERTDKLNAMKNRHHELTRTLDETETHLKQASGKKSTKFKRKKQWTYQSEYTWNAFRLSALFT